MKRCFYFFVAVFCLCLFSCSDLFEPSQKPALVVSVPSSLERAGTDDAARTVTRYAVTLYLQEKAAAAEKNDESPSSMAAMQKIDDTEQPADAAENVNKAQTNENGGVYYGNPGSAIEIRNISAGTYLVSVAALNASDEVVASGENTAVVEREKTTSVLITLEWTSDSEEAAEQAESDADETKDSENNIEENDDSEAGNDDQAAEEKTKSDETVLPGGTDVEGSENADTSGGSTSGNDDNGSAGTGTPDGSSASARIQNGRTSCTVVELYGILSGEASAAHTFTQQNPLTVVITDLTPDVSALNSALVNASDVFVALDLSACTGISELGTEASTNATTDAFQKCVNLCEIILPQTMATIHKYSFYKCEALSQVNLPENVSIIENCAFAYCSSLKTIELPRNITQLAEFLFWNSALEEITISAGVNTFGRYVFRDCASLKTVIFEEGNRLLSVLEGAFESCVQLRRLRFLIP